MAKHRTTLLLDRSLVQAARKALGTSSVTKTVERSLEEIVKRDRREGLRRRLGTVDLDLDLEQLRRLRRQG